MPAKAKKRFNRLIVYGDSFTYGHGLSDCFVPPNYAGDKPSELGWAVRLAKNLGISEWQNFSYPGASNRFISHKVLETDNIGIDDLVIVQFSFFNRDFYFEDSTRKKFIGRWSVDKFNHLGDLDKFWEWFIDRSEMETIHRTYEYILLVYFYLTSQKTNFHFLISENISSFEKYVFSEHNTYKPKTFPGLHMNNNTPLVIHKTFEKIKHKLYLSTVFSKTVQYGTETKDYALDNSHFSNKTQKFCARLMAEYIKKEYPNRLLDKKPTI